MGDKGNKISQKMDKSLRKQTVKMAKQEYRAKQKSEDKKAAAARPAQRAQEMKQAEARRASNKAARVAKRTAWTRKGYWD